MNKLVIDKLIIVEGKYDKIALENIVQADIFAVNGFSVFKDPSVKATIKALAEGRGVIVLTDSDTAGYKIRVYLSKILSENDIINIFIPQIIGKEKRKTKASAEGFLGVEGIDSEKLYNILLEYKTDKPSRTEIDSTVLYRYGYMGREGAKQRKSELCRLLGVQTNISNNFLLRILNERFTLKQFDELIINSEYEV